MKPKDKLSASVGFRFDKEEGIMKVKTKKVCLLTSVGLKDFVIYPNGSADFPMEYNCWFLDELEDIVKLLKIKHDEFVDELTALEKEEEL